jgi:hypothetical protein
MLRENGADLGFKELELFRRDRLALRERGDRPGERNRGDQDSIHHDGIDLTSNSRWVFRESSVASVIAQ